MVCAVFVFFLVFIHIKVKQLIAAVLVVKGLMPSGCAIVIHFALLVIIIIA